MSNHIDVKNICRQMLEQIEEDKKQLKRFADTVCIVIGKHDETRLQQLHRLFTDNTTLEIIRTPENATYQTLFSTIQYQVGRNVTGICILTNNSMDRILLSSLQNLIPMEKDICANSDRALCDVIHGCLSDILPPDLAAILSVLDDMELRGRTVVIDDWHNQIAPVLTPVLLQKGATVTNCTRDTSNEIALYSITYADIIITNMGGGARSLRYGNNAFGRLSAGKVLIDASSLRPHTLLEGDIPSEWFPDATYYVSISDNLQELSDIWLLKNAVTAALSQE